MLQGLRMPPWDSHVGAEVRSVVFVCYTFRWKRVFVISVASQRELFEVSKTCCWWNTCSSLSIEEQLVMDRSRLVEHAFWKHWTHSRGRINLIKSYSRGTLRMWNVQDSRPCECVLHWVRFLAIKNYVEVGNLLSLNCAPHVKYSAFETYKWVGSGTP